MYFLHYELFLTLGGDLNNYWFWHINRSWPIEEQISSCTENLTLSDTHLAGACTKWSRQTHLTLAP